MYGTAADIRTSDLQFFILIDFIFLIMYIIIGLLCVEVSIGREEFARLKFGILFTQFFHMFQVCDYLFLIYVLYCHGLRIFCLLYLACVLYGMRYITFVDLICLGENW